MKFLSAEGRALLAAGEPKMLGAARFDLPDGVHRFWQGFGVLTVPGLGDFLGVGANALLAPVGGELGSGASGVRLTLSALEPALATALVGAPYRNRPATLWRLIFDVHGTTLIDAPRFFVGRIEAIDEVETIGGTSAVEVSLEGSARDLSRTGGRLRSDTDQRLLGGPDDASFRATSIAGERTLSWGALPPTPVSSGLPGAVAPGPPVGYKPDPKAPKR